MSDPMRGQAYLLRVLQRLSERRTPDSPAMEVAVQPQRELRADLGMVAQIPEVWEMLTKRIAVLAALKEEM